MLLFSILVALVSLSSCLDQSEIEQMMSHKRVKRLAIHPSRWSTGLWPSGLVPFDIASHYTAEEKSVILSAMQEFHKISCIRFRPRVPSDKFYLQINKHYSLERCFSYIGRQVVSIFRTREGNYETRMKLDPSCLKWNGRGTVMHELMHILGFYHEHQRDDRDTRISGGSGHYNFKIYQRSRTHYMGAYDPTSIMHYNFPGVTYSRSYFSTADISRINTLYSCNKKPTYNYNKSRGPRNIFHLDTQDKNEEFPYSRHAKHDDDSSWETPGVPPTFNQYLSKNLINRS